MTLILSLTTSDFAIQVSDRRLTDAITGRIFTEPSVKLRITGQLLTDGERNSLIRNLRSCGVRGTSPMPVIRLMANSIRQVSRRNTTVGRRLMAACLPRPRLNAGEFYH